MIAARTQYRLLNTRWPRAVLRLPACRELRGADGLLAFRGPRVRMGIHFAAEGTIAHRRAPRAPARALPMFCQQRTAAQCTQRASTPPCAHLSTKVIVRDPLRADPQRRECSGRTS